MVDRRRLLGGFLGIGAVSIVGCSRDAARDTGPDATSSATPTSPAPTTPSPTPTEVSPVVERTVASGLNVPWAIAFLGGGDALITQRDEGTIVRVSPDGEVRSIGAVEGASGGPGGEAGLLGLAIDPDDESILFAYVTTGSDNRVVRMRWSDNGLTDQTPILQGIPRGPRHHGGALVFGPDGTLFVSTGEAGQGGLAQDRSSLGGKVLHIDRDGQPAPGGPNGGSGQDPVWTWGHRNIEGLAFDENGGLWASEFGDKRADELNRIEAGSNYGWPEVEGRTDGDRFAQPAATWPTDDCSPAGLAIARSTAFLGALQGECVWAVPLDGERAGEPVRYFGGEYGRIRAVAAAPDGSLWVGTSNTDGRGDVRDGDDRILRVSLDG